MKSKIILTIAIAALLAVGTYLVPVSADVGDQRDETLLGEILTALNGILDSSDNVDGEQIADNTIDDDSIDFTDVTGADLTLTDATDIASSGSFKLDIVVIDQTNATYTVLAADAGQLHVAEDMDADLTINLPAEAANLHYKFIYGGATADAHDWTIDTGANANYFKGGLVQLDPGANAATNETAVNYYSDGDSNSKIGVLTPESGTVVELWCEDGTTWYVNGTVVSDTDTGVTFGDQ